MIVQKSERRWEWALCYRDELFVRGNNTNNICESAMMIMKDYVLQRVKAYNMVQLADFVISRLDLYFEQKILNIAFNRLNSGLLTKQTYLERNVEFAENKIVEVESNVYSVPSEKDSSKKYVVNTDLSCCDCFVGRDGQLCKHQIAVAKYMGVTNRNILSINDPVQKQNLYYVATGKRMDLSFFQSLRDHQEESYNRELMTASSSSSSLKEQDNCDIAEKDYDQTANEEMDCSINECNESNSETKKTELEENLKLVFDDLLNELKTKKEMYLPAVEKFVKKYQNFKTDTNIIASLHNFGNTLLEGSTSTNVYALKRKGKKIRVQPTAISRRHSVALGKGSTSAAATGRPRKPKVLS